MAKNKTERKQNRPARIVETRDFEAPKGFVDQSGDFIGFWNEDLAPVILGTPVEARAFDSTQDPTKPSVLISFRLDAPIEVQTPDGEVVHAEPGDMVGVWGKPGMAALKNLSGVTVQMFCSGMKDVGKQNDMQVYKIRAASRGGPLLIESDYREKSKNTRFWLSGNVNAA